MEDEVVESRSIYNLPKKKKKKKRKKEERCKDLQVLPFLHKKGVNA
jgi:hypothetical protein